MSDDRLLSPELPAPRHIRRLVEHYFANIHPIRCFAFVHKPSFMRQLDSGFHSDDDSALLHVICAHGAKYDFTHLHTRLLMSDKLCWLTYDRFHALSLHQFDQVPSPALLRAAGNQWAKKAETILLSNYGKISVHRLMVRESNTTYHTIVATILTLVRRPFFYATSASAQANTTKP